MKTLEVKSFFKSVVPISITHERGTEILTNVVGQVKEIRGSIVYLKGLVYDFSISLSDFKNHNVSSK
jgi:hypothetical protein